MSSISAGKLNSTALVHTGDRIGELVFKTNTTQTALTLDSDQNASFTGDVVVAGNLTINGTTTSFGDGDKLVLGDGGDMEIYHDGTNSYISDKGTGNLLIDTQGDYVQFKSTQSNKTMATFNKDGSADLHHNDTIRLQTTSSGVTVSGTLDADNIPGTLGTEGQVLTVDAGGAGASWTDAAGGGSANFTASGALSNGDVVVLLSDGTVNTVTSSASELNPVTLGSTAAFSTNDVAYMSSVYDPDTGKIIIGYKDNTTTYPTAVVGTVSGTSITFGTPVVIESNQSDTSMKVVYDTAANKPVFLFTKYISGQEKHGQAVVGTVSGTSISFGTIVAFAGLSTSAIEYVDAIFDSGNNKIVAVYNNSNVTGRGATAIVGTVSGTSISFGTPTIWNSTSGSGLWIAYDANVGKVLVGMRFQDTNNPAHVGTVSGTSISFGSAVTFSTNAVGGQAIYDPSSQKILIVYADYAAAGRSTVTRVATISGDTVSFGSKTNLKTNSGENDGAFGLAYSPITNSIMVSLKDGEDSNTVKLVRATISGTQATYESVVSATLISSNGGTLPLVYDDTAGKFALLISDDVDGDNGKGVVITETSTVTNAADYIGVAAEDIDSAGTGSINIIGGINEGQTGLTVNTSYFVADDGSLTTTNNGRKIGRGVASTKLLVDTALTPAEMNAYLGGLV